MSGRITHRILLQPIRVLTDSADEEGRLVLVNDRLVAVLVHLADASHEELTGLWFLEAGFGSWASPECAIFDSLDSAQTWIAGRLECCCCPGAKSPASPA